MRISGQTMLQILIPKQNPFYGCEAIKWEVNPCFGENKPTDGAIWTLRLTPRMVTGWIGPLDIKILSLGTPMLKNLRVLVVKLWDFRSYLIVIFCLLWH